MGTRPFGSAIIADAHSLSFCGLVSLLQGKLSFGDVRQATRFDQLESALDADRSIRFLVIDIALPGLSGAGGLRALRLRHPSLIIVATAEGRERSKVLDVLAAGANGYIPKSMAADEMILAFRVVIEGQIYVPPTVTQVVEAAAPRKELNQPLTGRQRQVLEQLMFDKSNKDIARTLGITENTVKVHLAAAFRLLGVTNRRCAAAALWGMGPDPEPFLPGMTYERRRSGYRAGSRTPVLRMN